MFWVHSSEKLLSESRQTASVSSLSQTNVCRISNVLVFLAAKKDVAQISYGVAFCRLSQQAVGAVKRTYKLQKN